MSRKFTREEIYKLMWSRPSFAQLELTRNCNQSCVFCFDGCEKNTVYSDLPLEKWKYIIDQLHLIGVQSLHFSGGEDFLYPYFIGLIEYSKQLGFEIQINTNGSIDITDSLPFVDTYVFSVHGLGSLHDSIVRRQGSFDSAMKNIGIAIKAHKRVQISTVLIKENIFAIKKMFEYFDSQYDIDKYSFTLAASSLSGKQFDNHALHLTKQLFDDYCASLRYIGREKLVLKHGLYCIFDYEILSESKHYPPMPVCAAGKDKIIVKYNGDVYPCNYFQSHEFLCGNLLNQSILDIWDNGSGYKMFRDLVLSESLTAECHNCRKFSKCYGGCRVWTKGFIERGLFTNERDCRCELGNAFIGAGDNI